MKRSGLHVKIELFSLTLHHKNIKTYNEHYANNFRKNNKKNLIKYMTEYNLLKTQENKEAETNIEPKN